MNTEITNERITSVMKELSKRSTLQREIIIYTGVAGFELFNHNLRVVTLKNLLDLKKVYVTSEQYNRLISMLDSPDQENFTIAEILINKL